MDREKLELELSQLSHQQICWFAARCTLRSLPVLAFRGEQFPYWKNEASILLIVVFRAANASLIPLVRNVEANRDPEYSKDAAEGAKRAAELATSASAFPAAVAIRAAADAATAAYTNIADYARNSARNSAYADSPAAFDAAYDDLIYLKNNALDLSWPNLWHSQPPDSWKRLTDIFLKGMSQLGLDYWADEYQNWVNGRFDQEKMRRFLIMPEVTIKAGRDAILIYLRAEQLVRMAEARVVFLGEGEAGKTSLIRCLHGEEIRGDEPATPRVEIRQREEAIGGDNILVHYWDFGGQVIMHATHQFFLREKSVYVVVLDIRRCDSLEYWLDHVRVFAQGAPTFIVLNKVDSLPTEMERALQRFMWVEHIAC